MKIIPARKTVVFLDILIFGILFTIQKTNAASYYIDGDSGDDTRTTVQAQNTSTPWKTIQKAADNVNAGDNVYVKGGLTYSGTNSCYSTQATVCLTRSGTTGNYITYQAWPGTGIPKINGPISGRGFSVNAAAGVNYNRIYGFEIINTVTGIHMAGNNNILANNLIYDATLSSNSYGIYINSNNYSYHQYIYNNTIYKKNIGTTISRQGQIHFKNNIIVNSGNYGLFVDQHYQVIFPEITNNNIFNSSSKNYAVGIHDIGTSNYSFDPLFTNPAGSQFTLQSGSPSIDTGAAVSDVTIDIDLITRPRGGNYDMGAYESTYTNPSTNQTPYIITSPTNSMTRLASYTGQGTVTHFANSAGHRDAQIIRDINGDGFDDIIVGARHYSPGGGVHIFYGKSTPTDINAADSDVTLRYSTEPSVFGANVTLGDINHDGNLELGVNDYNLQQPQTYAGGSLFFQTGGSIHNGDESLNAFKITGMEANIKAGTPTEIIGDVNGDNFDDILFSGGYDHKFYLFYGSSQFSNKTIQDANVVIDFTAMTMCASTPPRFLPNADINKDGYIDIVIGCVYGTDGNTMGRVFIYYGSNNLSNKTINDADIAIAASIDDWGLGRDIAIGDLNNDGRNDLITKTEYETIYIFWGRTNWGDYSSMDADLVIRTDSNYPEIAGFGLGGGLATGDINNDSIDDLVTSDAILCRGYVFFGKKGFNTANASSADLVFDSGGWGDSLGQTINIGDFNNDKYKDIIFSQPTYNNLQGAVTLATVPKGNVQNSISSIKKISGGAVFSGTVHDDSYNIGGVQIRYNNGSWRNCSLTGPSSNTKGYECILSSLPTGTYTIDVRSFNELGIYVPIQTYTSQSIQITTDSIVYLNGTEEEIPEPDLSLDEPLTEEGHENSSQPDNSEDKKGSLSNSVILVIIVMIFIITVSVLLFSKKLSKKQVNKTSIQIRAII